MLSILNSPRYDTKQTIDDTMALSGRVKMVTGDQLAIADLGDHMYPSKMD